MLVGETPGTNSATSKVAAVERDLIDLGLGHRTFDLRARRFEHLRLTTDRNLRISRGHDQRGGHLERRARGKHQASRCVAESLLVNFDFVGSDFQIGKMKSPLSVRCGRAGLVGIELAGRHGCALHDGAARIGHTAADASIIYGLLRESEAHAQRQHNGGTDRNSCTIPPECGSKR